mmetsp:Transcript_49537/g.127866  ORF Transcript_49537/g.127866 Transcript_49537/m.127866 type:complete len:244 (-) Transcript_49537:42-773(-)
MAGVAWFLKEVRVHLENAVEVEGVQVDQVFGVHSALLTAEDRRERVDLLDPRLDRVELHGVGNEVGLVQQHPVRKGQLLVGLVHDAVRLHVVQARHDVLGVNDGADAVQLVHAHDVLVDEECGRHRRRVRHARGLDDHAVELRHLCVQLRQRRDEVTPDVAADAAVRHLDDLLVHVLADDHLVVHGDRPELVLDDGEAHAMVWGAEDVVQEGGLPRAEETRQDGDRHFIIIRPPARALRHGPR